MTKYDLLMAINDVDDSLLSAAERPVSAHHMTWKRALALAAAAMLLMGTFTAVAAANETFNNAVLYRIWPWASQALKPVNLNCEDQGIRMEVVSAALEGNEATVLLTMQDLTSDRLDESVDLFDSAALYLPYDSSSTCTLLSYDADTRTATFALYMRFYQQPAKSGKVTFSVSRFLSNKQEQEIDLTPLLGNISQSAAVLPGKLRGWGGSQVIPARAAEQVKVLDPQNSLEIPVINGVTLTGVGLVNGILHVQMRYDDILHTDNHGFLTLYDQAGNQYGHGELPNGISSLSWFEKDRSGISSSNSYQEYLFANYPQNLDELVLKGTFTTADPATEGNWQVTFPLSLIAKEEK